jgi:hypothetical protein
VIRMIDLVHVDGYEILYKQRISLMGKVLVKGGDVT